MKTLIIDDEIDICYLLSGILRQKNCHTNYVNNLADAVVQLKNSPPFIVFLDNHLPDGLGIDFVAHIKKNYPDTKIIMITAYDTIDDRQQAINKGVDIFIGKPFTKEAIISAIEDLNNSHSVPHM
ncbi:response regulator [Ferruginibacter sp.]|uniref:response regulator n=1 Tax=Ferruginibacter sp. TaxID=1940288 RepID=UPI001988ECDA|nr:response regulator [Ferruginibacter sp.]MBC7626279.1 response regulator [Ferruginibacter sp.]